MGKFNDIYIGQSTEIHHAITADDINKFVDLTGDNNRIHTDSVYAAKTSFKKPVAHGMLGASFISTIIGTKLPGDGALWFAQNIEFLLPVRVGDTLTIRAEVIKKDERSQVIELKTDITNQHRQKVIQGFAKVKVIDQEPELAEVAETREPEKVALVIGGSGGIGSAVCLALAAEGYNIAVHYFSNADLAKNIVEKIAEKGQKAFPFSADITDQDKVNNMVKAIVQYFGTISVLVNCSTSRIAAIKINSLVWEDFEAHINNQILGAFNIVQAIVPHMEKQQYGKIIHINSQLLETPSVGMLPYITAKGALMGFTRALAFELAPKGILVNSVSPGMTDTDQIADIPEKMRMLTAAKTPLKRLATPVDVAKAVVFLASSQSDYLCGETIRVNGGQVML